MGVRITNRRGNDYEYFLLKKKMNKLTLYCPLPIIKPAMFAFLYEIGKCYFNPWTVVVSALNIIISAWIYPILRSNNDHFNFVIFAFIQHLLDIFQSSISIIPSAQMEAVSVGIVERYFANFFKTHDFDHSCMEQNRDKINLQKRNLINRLQQYSDNVPDDLISISNIIAQFLFLSIYIPNAYAIAIITCITIFYVAKSADAKRFTNEDLNAKNQYLNGRTRLELYHDPEHSDQHIQRIETNQYDMSISVNTYQHNIMMQRIGIDFAVLGFILYCVIYSWLYGDNNDTTFITCSSFLKNIPQIRRLSKFYFSLHDDFVTYEATCKGLLIEKVPQIPSFNNIDIPPQSVSISDVKLEIPRSISIPGTGVILITGPSGAGKTTFLDILAGMRPSSMTVDIDESSTIPISSIRSLCNVYNHSIAEIKSVTPEQLITSFGKFGVDARTCASIVALPAKFKLNDRTSSSTSKGEFQRISVAEMVARLMSNKSKQVTIWDELTDGMEDAKALELVQNIIRQFSTDRLVMIVTHNTFVRNNINATRIIDVSDFTITQIL